MYATYKSENFLTFGLTKGNKIPCALYLFFVLLYYFIALYCLATQTNNLILIS